MSAEPATVAITRSREPDWLLVNTLRHLARQSGVRLTVLVLDQQDSAVVRTKIEALQEPEVRFVYAPIAPCGISEARNRALQLCETDLLLYCDTDCSPDPLWAGELIAALAEPDVAIAGSRILPRWAARPLAVARSRLVQEMYSLLDFGPESLDVGKVVGCYAVRRSRLGGEAYFEDGRGRAGGTLRGGEETDLCRRLAARGQRVRYVGSALVWHEIQPERIRYRWLARRVFAQGRDRAGEGRAPQPSHKLAFSDLGALTFILPFYAAGYLRGRVSA
ncbi:glycosyltransferase family 2 protein [Rhodovibrio sodomensis]|nr:glycosyltransferase [Rhodovibrio sodomensis]